jgi:hypothetical protein
VLTDQDRISLAPHLSRLRQATADLAGSREQLASAEQTIAQMADGDWRERRLGGLFSHDSGKAQQYRDAVRAKKDLTKLIEHQEAQTGRLTAALDDLLKPILRSNDTHYRELLMALRRCDEALSACRTVTDSINSASQAARLVVKMLSSNPAGPTDQRYDIDVAAGRYDDSVRHARQALPTLAAALQKAGRGVTAATGIAVDQPAMPQPALLEDLPGGMTTLADRYRIAAALTPLRNVHTQAETAANVVTKWRKRTDKARRQALRAAHDLI